MYDSVTLLYHGLGDEYARAAAAENNNSLQKIHDYHMKAFPDSQRWSVGIVITVLFIIAILGNSLSLFYNFRRNIRPIFRTCLISLACSDIITVTFVFVAYVAQMTSEYQSIWTLGDILCSLVPFAQTAAILVNSFTLVGIALDRYWAVVKFIHGTWNPTAIFCTAWAVFVWGLAAGIASPLITSYYLIEFIIVETDGHDRTVEIGTRPAAICVGDKETTKYYYTVVFNLIFAPLIIVFVWLNSVIAKEIWKKRRPIDARSLDSANYEHTSLDKHTPTKSTAISSAYLNGQFKHSLNDGPLTIVEHSQVSTITTTTSASPTAHAGNVHWLARPSTPHTDGSTGKPCYGPRRLKSCREMRQVRMFKAVLMLMIIFIVCRMPTWIYLLIKLYNVSNTNSMWMLHFSLGLLSVMSCVLNPFLYTFLLETIQYSCRFMESAKRIICFCRNRPTKDMSEWR